MDYDALSARAVFKVTWAWVECPAPIKVISRGSYEYRLCVVTYGHDQSLNVE